ncbi:hypothetical protein Ping_3110 [Psychromonas ingrahamii 37]|uniref:HNH endonuclease 5 domain-containing protein n=1 Tax=Psychromonas ingrahamii (strain DSM 17664 / CCUG 51855 / 37) TaxID=357804 RepID=A1SZ92_PSYIN|nr:HNH endonuclease [Psychromonas ingrahamii]ABM04807.1 hypothetical protein Ping_3110 [Psychromonas ingrahamii 37]
MKNCYFCKKEFDTVNVRMHDEHIIQNSIGGKLTSSDILCEKCGGVLGQNVDEAFTRNLSPLSVLLDLARDRGESSKSRIRIVMNDGSVLNDDNVTFELKNDFSIIPSRPVYILNEDEKTLNIFGATLKQINQFEKSKVIKKLINEGYKVKKEVNVASYVNSAVLDINYESPDILRGILKAAIGFASHHGVPNKYLSQLTNVSKLIDSDNFIHNRVWQYYPTTDEEKIYETNKEKHEDWYPNHQIYLFNIGENLYCYVELFGVIQKYVHLTDSYDGDEIREKYLQKTTKWEFNEEDWKPRRLSDLQILAQQFDVPYSNEKIDDIGKTILQRARSRSYIIDSESQTEKVEKIMQSIILYTTSDIRGYAIVDELHDKADMAKSKFNFSLVDKIKNNPLSAMQLMHKDYSDFRIGDVNNSCPLKSKSLSENAKNKYVAYKAFELLSSLNLENKIEFKVIDP